MRLFKPFSNRVQLSTKQEWNRRIKDDSVLNAIICPEWIEQFSIMIEKVLRWNHHHHHYRRWGNVGFSPTDAAIFFLEHLLLQGGSKLKSQRVLSVKQQAFSYLAAKNVIYWKIQSQGVSGPFLQGLLESTSIWSWMTLFKELDPRFILTNGTFNKSGF